MAKINGIGIKVVDNTYKHNPLNVVSTDTIKGYQSDVRKAASYLIEEIDQVNPDMDEIIRYANRVKFLQKKVKASAHRTYAVEEIKKVLLADMETDTLYTLTQLVDHVFKVYQLYVSETSHHFKAPTPNAPVHGVRYALEELEKMGVIGHTLAEVEKENPRPYRKKVTGVRRVYFLK